MTLTRLRHTQIFTIFGFLLLFSGIAEAQSLEKRVNALEEYVETFQPTLIEFSEELQDNIQKYTKGLEASLDSYSKSLQQQVNTHLESLKNDSAVLDLNTQAFQSVDTNGGRFLVSVDRVEKMPSGAFRIYLNIGNINFADYNGFKIKLIWGKKFYPGFAQKMSDWRETLRGAEYTFEGALLKGSWNQVEIDIEAADSGELAHVEFEMTVLSVELQSL